MSVLKLPHPEVSGNMITETAIYSFSIVTMITATRDHPPSPEFVPQWQEVSSQCQDLSVVPVHCPLKRTVLQNYVQPACGEIVTPKTDSVVVYGHECSIY